MNKKKSIVAVISVLLVALIGIGIYISCAMPDVWNWKKDEQHLENLDDGQNVPLLVNQTLNGEVTKLSFNASESNKLTVADLKNQFLAAGVDNSNKYMFKPFYNVAQTTEFTFHFNSKVDPVKAITVHTDEKCDYQSLVWQINAGYWTEDGVDVVVKPSSSTVLYSENRNGEAKNNWGYAPIYYICIRYDLDSKEVKKLDEPIIIPFTIKNEISTPTVYANIDEKGNFSVKWNKVDGAVAYKVYSSGKSFNELTTSEGGYKYNPTLLTTINATDKLEYNPGVLQDEKQLMGTGYSDNTVRKTSEEYNVETIVYQNNNLYNHKLAIYVTAVDENGNESNFGFPVDLSEYKKILPYSIKYMGTITELPETIEVQSVDMKTTVTYPINFYKLSEPQEYSRYCDYRYEVVGTMLTGIVTYENENKIFPNEKISTYKVNTSGLPQGTMDRVPQVTVDTFADSDYSNSKVDLKKTINYPEDAQMKLDPALMMVLVDKDLARRVIGTDSTETDPREEYDSFLQSEDPDYILIREGTKITVRKVDKDNKVDEPTQTTTPEKEPEQTITPEEPAEEIDNSNYVEEQEKSTKKQVEEGDAEEVKGTKYPVFADNAAQLYLALALINQEPVISLKAFPEYQVANNLIDDLYYIWLQNPYIMGIDINECYYVDNGLALKVSYNVPTETAKKYQEAVYEKSQKVANQIIKAGMTDSEKVVAIYEYLENNAKYNKEAYAAALELDASTVYKKYPNSWNTYGILCEGIGVCQSYAYAFNSIAYFSDLETVMVTGYMQGGGHAWNAVKLDGMWYMVDPTNNGSSGFPYWICNASTEYIESRAFSLDSCFVDGTDFSEYLVNNNTQDWYYKNNLMAGTIDELATIWEKNYKHSNNIWIKYIGSDNPAESNNLQKFVTKVFNDGYSETDIEGWNILYYGGLVSFKK